MIKGTLRSMSDLLGKAAGTEIAGLIKLPDGSPAPWKEVLRRTFADVEEAMTAQGSDCRMVFFWDEVPYLLDNIAKREGHAVAMEVLDALRSLGQDFDRIRLLLTGSIGMHHSQQGRHRDFIKDFCAFLTQEELPVIDELFRMNADQLCRRYVGSLACLNHSEWESNLQVRLPRFDDLNALMILSEELVAQTAELQQSLPGSKATILWLETWK